MVSEEEIQQQYLQFQTIQQQIEEVSQHLEFLTQQIGELDISINAVNELKKTALNNELLAPIANGIFIKAELKENQKLIVNVGSDVTVEKTIPEVVELLEIQKKEINKKMIEFDNLLQNLSAQAMEIYHKIEETVQ